MPVEKNDKYHVCYDEALEKDDLVNIRENLQDIRFYLTSNQVLVSDFLCVPEHFRSM